MVTATDQKAPDRPLTFDLCGGHPVLDFVNSLDNRFNNRNCVENLQNYADLLRFAHQTQLLDSAQSAQIQRALTSEASKRALRAAWTLRGALAATFYAVLDARPPASTDLETLEHYFLIADCHRKLRWQQCSSEPSGLVWTWQHNETNAELPVWMVAYAAHELMLSLDMQRVRACEAQTCRWLFLDTSKNHTRRWCKMNVCGNRVKARRYQARHSG